VADGQLIEAVVGNGNIETHYAPIHNDGTTLKAPTINYLNDQLELRDRRMRDLEAKIVDLESKMTALSESVSDWRCTSVGSNRRFSHMTGFTLCEGLNYVEKGRHRGDEEVGDEEADSGNGDQKRNAEGQEGKQDNEEDENGNGDQKLKAHKKRLLKKVIRLLMPTVLSFHIIEIIFILQEEAKDVLLEQTQDSSTKMSSAILMPSSNALQVVRIWVIMMTSCGIHQEKSIDILNSITSLNL
jgi:hypothetical protein